MSFIRAEARSTIWRWRESLAGIGVFALGLWWVLGTGRLMSIIGAIAIVAGAALALVGYQRARFRTAGDGIGSVDVDEGQVTYFGPLSGGALAMRDLQDLALVRSRQTPHWRLSDGNDALYIPVNADGADALFDAFTVLPGLKVERMLSVLADENAHDTVIWSREDLRPSTLELH